MGELFKGVFKKTEFEAATELTPEQQVLETYITAEKIKARTLPSEQAGEITDISQNTAAEFQQALNDIEYHGVRFVNEYLRVDFMYFNSSNAKKTLTDGTEIGFGEILLRIHIEDISNVRTEADVDESHRTYIVKLKELFMLSLKDLARLITDPQFEYRGAAAVYGITYLANRKMAETLGFDTEAIHDPEQALQATKEAYGIILRNQYGYDAAKWAEVLKATPKLHAPRLAFMSKQKLLELYGEKVS